VSHPAVRRAGADDLDGLAGIERAANTLFAGIGFELDPGSATALLAPRPTGAPPVLVVGRPPVGFAQVELVDASAHLETLAVHPDAMRRGIGTALVGEVCRWAAQAGYATVTLLTYRDVPWNGPFYRSLGFEEMPSPTPGLLELRARERANGLDELGPRLVMVCRLDRPAPPTGNSPSGGP
jgi:GNAT superfamily N-acetyltransferase